MSFWSRFRPYLPVGSVLIVGAAAAAFNGCSASDTLTSPAPDSAIGEVRQASTVMSGFTDTPLVINNGLNRAISMTFAPDGRLFVSFQDGDIKIVKNIIGQGSNSVLSPIKLPLCTSCKTGERGLLGLTLDPAFPQDTGTATDPFKPNAYVYVYYTTDSGGIHNRISRFKVIGDTIVGPEEQLANLETRTADIHNGGAMHFGNDGKLYVTSGVENPGDPALSLGNTFGKLLRFNKDGTIPSDNPFFNDPATTSLSKSIWSLGLRNPFTFAVRRTTGKIYLNDVGASGFEEINVAAAGANYQWPKNEGTAIYSGTLTGTKTGALYAYSHGANNENCAISGGTFYDPPTVTFPSAFVGRYFFSDWCNHKISYIDPAVSPVTATVFASNVAGSPNAQGNGVVDLTVGPDGALYYLARGGATSSGVIGRISANVQGTAPSFTVQPGPQAVSTGQSATFSASAAGTSPLNYEWLRSQGTSKLVNGDFGGNTGASWTTTLGANSVTYAGGVADFTITSASVNTWDVQLKQGVSITSGTQYTLCYDVKTDEANRTIDVVVEQSVSPFTNRGLNVAGVPVTPSWAFKSHTFAANLTDATARVVFQIGKSSNDVQIDNVRLVTGGSCFNAIAGATSSTYVLASAVSGDNGALFRARATNTFGTATSLPAMLTVLSGSPPTATITAPSAGSTYVAGTTLSFSGSGSDAEDGALPASANTWTIDLYHDNHAHPAMPATSGIASGTFAIPNSGHTETDVWLRVTLSVKDSSGLTGTTFVDVDPVLVNLSFATQPTGLVITLDGQPFVAPFATPSVAGVIRQFAVASPQTANNASWLYSNWSNGGAQTQNIAPLANASFTATFSQCTNCGTGAWISTGAATTVAAAGWTQKNFTAATATKVRFCGDEDSMAEVFEIEARSGTTARPLTLESNPGGYTPVANLTDGLTTSAATVATTTGAFKCVTYTLGATPVSLDNVRVFSDFAGNWKLDHFTIEYWNPNASP